jgi:hypothetical protein
VVNRSGGSVTLLGTYQQYKKFYDSPQAYFAITGIQQVITSVLVILIILEKIDITTKKHIWVRVLTILLIFNFAFNFVIAVNASMTATYCNELYKDQIDQLNRYSGGYLDDYIRWLVATVRYVTAEAVLTFVISIPLLAIIIIAFVENTFRVEYELDSENHNETTLTKIKI